MIYKKFYASFVPDKQDITPTYRQLARSIIRFIQLEKLPVGLRLPSINALTTELDIPRDTGVRAYQDLRKWGIVGSVPGKGYFISKTAIDAAPKVCVLFKDLTESQKVMDDSIISALPENAALEFHSIGNTRDLLKEFSGILPERFTHYILIT